MGGARSFVVLWAGLTLLSLLLLLTPSVPTAWPSPELSLTLAGAAATVSLGLVYLSTLRFRALGTPLDLFAGLGFGTLALASLSLRLLGAAGAPTDPVLYLAIFTGAAAGGLFLVGLRYVGQVVEPADQARFGWVRAAYVAAVLLAALVVLVPAARLLPGALDQRGLDLLAAGRPIYGFLPGQAPLLLIASACVALLHGAASLGYTSVALRSPDPHLRLIAVSLTLQFFGQLHTLAFPPAVVDYVSLTDGFRLGTYLLLLLGLMARLGHDAGDQAARAERLRLSRELHDGLAQQLSLLNLRLSHASQVGRPAEKRDEDLRSSRRLVEAALLEARQAITSLREGSSSWQELSRAAGTLTAEFGRNHEVQVTFTARGATDSVDADLHVTVLRMLYEACSNAVRHGGASRIDVRLDGDAEGVELHIQDDGQGFDSTLIHATPGVGIRSMIERLQRRNGSLNLDSVPGHGATIRAWLPLQDRTRRPR